jgi:hypothetical protein
MAQHANMDVSPNNVLLPQIIMIFYWACFKGVGHEMGLQSFTRSYSGEGSKRFKDWWREWTKHINVLNSENRRVAILTAQTLSGSATCQGN